VPMECRTAWNLRPFFSFPTKLIFPIRPQMSDTQGRHGASIRS
jgi:hypothetical protein